MDQNLNEDQLMLRESVRGLAESEASISHTRELLDDAVGFDLGVWKRGCDQGWTGVLVPAELGGTAIDGTAVVDAGVVAEELGRVVYPGPFGPSVVVADTVARFGSPEAIDRVLLPMLSGDVISVWARPPGGPSVASVDLTARSDWDGVRISGTVPGVESAAAADYLLLTAHAESGVVQALVPTTGPGVSIRPTSDLDITRRAADVTLTGAPVAEPMLLAPTVGGEAIVSRQNAVLIAMQLAETVGLMSRVMELTVAYMHDRVAFGRPIGTYQALKHRIADLKLWFEASAATTAACMRALAASNSDDARIAVSVAKSFVDDSAALLVQDCIQLHGGIGTTWEHDLHLYLRRAIVNQSRLGTPREHRAELLRLIGIDV